MIMNTPVATTPLHKGEWRDLGEGEGRGWAGLLWWGFSVGHWTAVDSPTMALMSRGSIKQDQRFDILGQGLVVYGAWLSGKKAGEVSSIANRVVTWSLRHR